MQLDPEAPVVVVPMELRGDNSTRFVDMVLDTGATGIVIPWHLAHALWAMTPPILIEVLTSPRRVR